MWICLNTNYKFSKLFCEYHIVQVGPLMHDEKTKQYTTILLDTVLQSYKLLLDTTSGRNDSNGVEYTGTWNFIISDGIAAPNINDDEYKLDLDFCKVNQLPQCYDDQLSCNVIVKVTKSDIRQETNKSGADETSTPMSYYRCKCAITVPEDEITIIANGNVVKNQQYYNLPNGFTFDNDITHFNNEKTKFLKTQINTATTIDVGDTMEMSLNKFLEKIQKQSEHKINPVIIFQDDKGKRRINL